MNALQRACVRSINGTIQIGGRCWRWPWEPDPEPEDGEDVEPLGFWGRTRRCGLLLAAGFAAYRLSLYWPWLAPLGVAVVMIYGYREAMPIPAAAARPQEITPLVPALTRAAMRAELIDTIRSLADGLKNVHLADVHAQWLDRGLVDAGRTLTEFRAFAESLGIPVRDSVKARGNTRIGVRVADLPPTDPEPAAETPPPAIPGDRLQDW